MQSQKFWNLLYTTKHREIIAAISINNNTGQGWKNEMASNVEAQVYSEMRNCKCRLQFDESTLPSNDSLLLVYVRYAVNCKGRQELLFAQLMETDTNGKIYLLLYVFKARHWHSKYIVMCSRWRAWNNRQT